MRVIAIILLIILSVFIFIRKQSETVIPEFSDEFNQIVCIEEHL